MEVLFKIVKENENYSLYYRDKILFKNEKNNPFLCLKQEKDGVKKLIPFDDFEITKKENNRIEISFFSTVCVVKLLLVCDEKNVYFSFTKHGKQNDRLYIRLYKNSTKTAGFGLNAKTDFERFRMGVLDKLKEKKHDKKFLNLDNTLNFYVQNSYYFSNGNINDWKVETGSAITVSSAQENIEFKLEFNKNFNFLPQKSFKILKTTSFSQWQDNDNYDGFIVDYSDVINNPLAINKSRNQGKKILIRITPDFDTTSCGIFDKNTLFKADERLWINIKDNDNVRKFCNYLRGVFDLNPDGIYIDEKNLNLPKNLLIKNVLFYENLSKIVDFVKTEYPKKIIIYNKLNSPEKFFINKVEQSGKPTVSVRNAVKENSFYSITYSDIKHKENVFVNNLLFSGYRSIFYECTEKEVHLLQNDGKMQLIVTPKTKFGHRLFGKKK